MTRGAKYLAALVRDHGLHPFRYTDGRTFVNVHDVDLAEKFRLLGKPCLAYKPEAVTNPGRVAWEIRLDRRKQVWLR